MPGLSMFRVKYKESYCNHCFSIEVSFWVNHFPAVKIAYSILQTVWTQIRLLPREQSDLGS